MATTQVEVLLAGIRDTSGNSLNGGFVYTYSAGTNTAKTTWTDKDKSSPAANPIVLDSNGRAQIYADGVYKLIVKNSSGTTLYTWDNLKYGVSGSYWSNFSDYASLSAAITAIGSTVTELRGDASINLGGNSTVPSNISIIMSKKGSIVNDASYSLAINGPFEAGCYAVFSGFSSGLTFGAGSTSFVRPEWWGAKTDGTDSYSALQSCFAAVQASTYRPFIQFVAGKYTFGTALTINNAEGIRLEGGSGGYYTPQPAGYSSKVSILYYTGNGIALQVGDNVNTTTGFCMNSIAIKGTSSADGGLFFYSAGGITLRDCVFQNFTKTNAYGVRGQIWQVSSLYNCSFLNNYYGVFEDARTSAGVAATYVNTTIKYHDCVFLGNTKAGYYSTGNDMCALYNPIFQTHEAGAILINIPTGAGASKCLNIFNPYFEDNCKSAESYVIDITGDSTVGYKIRSLHISGGFYAGTGYAYDGITHFERGFCRLRYTMQTIIDFPRVSNTLPKPFYVIDNTKNTDILFINWDKTMTNDYCQDESGNTESWTRIIQETGAYEIHGGSSSQEIIKFKQISTSGPFINLHGTSTASVASSISTWTNGASIDGFIKLYINGVAKWMPYYTAPTS